MEIQYYEHTCLCGYNGRIKIRKRHSWAGIPLYIHGHNRKGKYQTIETIHKIKNNHSKYWKGKKQTQEHKIKNSYNRVGKYIGKDNHRYGKLPWNFGLTKETNIIILISSIKNSESQKGKISSFKGKKHTEESKNKNRISHLGLFKGTNSPNWQGGKSFEPYSPEFNKKLKQQILKRDTYTCQDPNCKHKTDRLDVHHIDYNKLNNTFENLIVLCKSCHAKTNVNNKRNYFTEYYQNIMIDILE